MSTPIVVDTCVLINFLCINRMDLIGRYPGTFVATEDVADEIIYNHERDLYEKALANDHLVQVDMDLREIGIRRDIFRGEPIPGVHLHGRHLERGERSVLAVAISRNYSLLASDDRDVIRYILELAAILEHQLSCLCTQDIMLELIERQVLSVEEADLILVDWRKNHKFNLKIGSFRELL